MNAFFSKAIRLATRLIARRSRLLRLVGEVSLRVAMTERSQWSWPRWKERMHVFIRLARAYAAGTYSEMPAASLVAMVAALIYFLNPLDLVPDALPALGLTDDMAVLGWVYQSLAGDVRRFLDWELRETSTASSLPQ